MMNPQSRAFQRSIYLNPKRVAAKRRQLIRVFGPACMKCGTGPESLTVDHIRSPRYGGTNDIENLQLLCEFCNKMKQAATIDYRPYTFATGLARLESDGIA